MMGRATILTILSFWLSVAQAAENSFGPQCPDFSVTGIESKEKFGSFLFDLRILLRQNHESVASDLVMYPLRVNGKISELINSEAELLRKYDSVFTDAVIKSIGRAASDDLSCNAEGVIFGEGDSYIWVTERDGKVGVVAVNLPVSTPSFDCSKASSSTEKIICDNPELGALDQDLNKRYKLALTQSDVVKKQQKIWLKTIKRCTDDVCLINEYKSRISVLSSVGIQSGSDKLYVEEVVFRKLTAEADYSATAIADRPQFKQSGTKFVISPEISADEYEYIASHLGVPIIVTYWVMEDGGDYLIQSASVAPK